MLIFKKAKFHAARNTVVPMLIEAEMSHESVSVHIHHKMDVMAKFYGQSALGPCHFKCAKWHDRNWYVPLDTIVPPYTLVHELFPCLADATRNLSIINADKKSKDATATCFLETVHYLAHVMCQRMAYLGIGQEAIIGEPYIPAVKNLRSKGFFQREDWVEFQATMNDHVATQMW